MQVLRPATLLRELIALPSVNPAFVPAGDPRGGESRVAEYLAELARVVGLETELWEIAPGRPNCVVRFRSPGRVRRRVVLAPHLDTVGGDDPGLYRPRLVRGRIHGRGACDTKGSVAAMFSALGAVARRGLRPRATEIVFVGLVDEEHRQTGSRAWARRRWRADLAIVGEPTRRRVVTAHKGVLWLELETRGRAAHGARPELGQNAITQMARVIETCETSYREQLRRRKHPVLGHPSINVGRIEGGVQANIVPDRCRVWVDRRMIPGETAAGVMRELRETLSRGRPPVLIHRSPSGACPPLETSEELPFVRQFMRVAGQRRPAGVHYFSDAAILAQGGIPTVVFGPGDIAQAHTADEWVSIAELDEAARCLEGFLRGLP